MPATIEPHHVNKLPGCVLRYENGDVAVAAMQVEGERIARMYIVSNPDKLRHLGAPEGCQ